MSERCVAPLLYPLEQANAVTFVTPRRPCPLESAAMGVENRDMDADLFSPADAAALLAIRAVIAERMLSAIELRALFDASGLVRGPDARARAAIKTALSLQGAPETAPRRR
jgi:hypothetical protein